VLNQEVATKNASNNSDHYSSKKRALKVRRTEVIREELTWKKGGNELQEWTQNINEKYTKSHH
jgi:hypothetical protein